MLINYAFEGHKIKINKILFLGLVSFFSWATDDINNNSNGGYLEHVAPPTSESLAEILIKKLEDDGIKLAYDEQTWLCHELKDVEIDLENQDFCWKEIKKIFKKKIAFNLEVRRKMGVRKCHLGVTYDARFLRQDDLALFAQHQEHGNCGYKIINQEGLGTRYESSGSSLAALNMHKVGCGLPLFGKGPGSYRLSPAEGWNILREHKNFSERFMILNKIVSFIKKQSLKRKK